MKLLADEYYKADINKFLLAIKAKKGYLSLQTRAFFVNFLISGYSSGPANGGLIFQLL